MDIIKGNFNDQASLHRGWVVGHFIEDLSPLKTKNLEIKWGIHKAGEHKEFPAQSNTSKSLGILIRGKFTCVFENQKITLDKEGDYCFWDSSVAHSWTVEQDCLLITIRWPSLPEDQKPIAKKL